MTAQTGMTGKNDARATAVSRSSISRSKSIVLAAHVAVHQGLVLGLLDDALDQRPAMLFDERLLVVARWPHRRDRRRRSE